MSDSSYIAMQTPKKGLKSVGDPMYQGPDYKGRFGSLTNSDNWNSKTLSEWIDLIVLGPFRSVNGILSVQLAFSMVLSFLGSMLYAIVFVYSQSNMNPLPVINGFESYVRLFILAVISASMYYVTTLWSFYDDFPTIIYPAHALSLIATSLTRTKDKTFGLTLALFYCAFIFAGYAAGGGILTALNVTGVYQNVPVNNNSLHLFWFGATIIAFSFLFNRVFAQDDEKMRKNHSRSSKATALAIFAMMVAFGGPLKIETFTSGLYLTQYIVAAGVSPTNGSSYNAIAYYFCVDLLAVAATTVALVVIFRILNMFGEKKIMDQEVESVPQPATFQAAGISSNMSSSARLTQRTKLAVQY